jgi:phenylacetate-coenzyme A ligase PaaK-like adenylate-forming protein
MLNIKRIADLARALLIRRMLARHEQWGPENLAHHQERRLAALVRHAVNNSRFYRQHYEGLRTDGAIDIKMLPVTNKKLMMDNFDDVVTDQRIKFIDLQEHLQTIKEDAYYLGEYRAIATSGTSGLRGIFVFNRREWSTILANTLRWNQYIGVTPRLPKRTRITSIGADAPMHVTHRIPQSADVGLFQIQHLEATAPITELTDALNAFQPDVVLPYPSMAAILAVEQIEGRLNIRPSVVSTHSEVLTQDMFSKIEMAWGIQPFNHYGLTEEPHIGTDCSRHEGIHIFEDLTFIEIVDENNQPVPDGTPGHKYLLTNLYNYTQPLIRYEVTDMISRSPRLCSCGRAFGLIEGIGGRSEDILYLNSSEGRTVPVPPLFFEMCIEAFPEVAEFRTVHQPDLIQLSIVPTDGADLGKLEAGLTDRLQTGLSSLGAVAPAITIEFVYGFERQTAKMGKIKLVGAAPRASQTERT